MALVEDIVEVGITQAVRELVTDGTDAIDAMQAHLSRAGVRVYLDTVELEVHAGITKIRGVGPDGLIGTTGSLALPGIDDVDLVYLAVASPVILPKVYLAVYQTASLGYHLLRVLVLVVIIIIAIVTGFLRHRYRAHNVEVDGKLAIALVTEVVFDTALEVVHLQAFFIGHTVVESLVVGTLKLGVLEVNQDDKALLDTLIIAPFARDVCLTTAREHGIGLAAALSAMTGQCLTVGTLIAPALSRAVGCAVICNIPVGILVAHQLGLDS